MNNMNSTNNGGKVESQNKQSMKIMKAIVAGVSGAGKTTIVNKLKGRLRRDHLKVINFGTAMLTVAKREFDVRNRDELRYLERGKQLELQDKAIDLILEESETGRTIIIDTHFAIKTPNGYMPGLPMELLKKFEPDILFLITARPEEIWERRMLDITRKRPNVSIDDIIEEEKVNISYLMAYSAISGAYAKIVKNATSKVDEAVDEILKTLTEADH